MHNTLVRYLVLFACAAPVVVRADETPRTGVIDRANVMKPGEMQQLNQWLLELEQKTTAQLKVLIVPSTNGRDVYQYSIDMARQWRLGQKGKNNGGLVVVAVDDRKWHIQVGEGIEHALPDLLCDQIAQTYFVPNFKAGDYSHGIFLGTIELARALAKDSNTELGGLPAQGAMQPGARQGRRSSAPSAVGFAGCFTPFLVLMVIVVIIVSNARRMNRSRWAYGRRRGFSTGNFLAGMLINQVLSGGRRGGSDWGGGGGFGGGGGSGFGGGGGGSFGGGGAGGGW